MRPYLPAATRLPIIVWDGSQFRVFRENVDAVAAMPGVLLTLTFRTEPEGYRCIPGGFSVHCGVFPAEYKLEWRTHTAIGPSRPHGVLGGSFYAPYAPGVVAGHNEFAIAWRTSLSIDGRRMGRDGAPVGMFSIPLPRAITGRRGPQIAWDGTRYLVVFDMAGETGDIWGAVVIPGQTYIANPFLIAGGAQQEFAPAVTTIGPDQFLVAYTIGNDAIGTRVVSFREPEPPSRRRATR